MPTLEELQQAAESSRQAGANAASATAKAGTIGQELSDALRGVVKENTPLIEGRNKAMADYLAAGPNARASYGDPNSPDFIFNPYERAKLVANEKSLAYQPYANLTDYLGLTLGSIPDTVSRATEAYKASLIPLQTEAATAAQNYQDLLTLYGLQEDKRRYEEGKKTSANNPFADAIASLLGGGQSQDFGQPPAYSPAEGPGSFSTDGNWYFNNDGSWIPVVD